MQAKQDDSDDVMAGLTYRVATLTARLKNLRASGADSPGYLSNADIPNGHSPAWRGDF